ncbi:hypothetical protein Hdeb2414_s0005g00171431 [Helianthus debilis subsp. tardiflorus]
MDSLSSTKRVRSDSADNESDSPQPKRIQLDLLDTLDDSDEFTSAQDLDSFIKSFQDEISPQPETLDRTSDSGESRPDLEFLLEASDDELGLPPPTESDRIPDSVSTESVELGVFSWLDDQIPNYNSFEYGFEYVDDDASINSNGNGNGEYVALDGLFDYTDLGFGPSDSSSRTESLPAQ